MKRIELLILSAILSTTLAFSQAKITFKEMTHDFGLVYEDDEKATYVFTFKNTGTAPLIITQAVPSCGCTTPVWTKEPVAPGEEGQVTAIFATRGRPGPFSKTITINSNSAGGSVQLVIKGSVGAKRPNPEALYPVAMGDLRMKQALLNFGTMPITGQVKQSLEVFNNGKKPITLSFNKLPKYMTASVSPTTIPENSSAVINFAYNASLAKKYGSDMFDFNIVVNNDMKAAANNKVRAMATVIDEFKPENAASAPKLNVQPAVVDFGKLSDKGAKTTQILKISNSGKSELFIRDIKVNSQALIVSAPKKSVKPGEIIEIKLAIQPKRVVEDLSGVVSLITNDPNNAIKDIRFTVKP